jgi:hypothetical protein
MRLCKGCSNSVRLFTARCERCGRAVPGISRRALRRTAIQGGTALAAIALLTAFALAG